MDLKVFYYYYWIWSVTESSTLISSDSKFRLWVYRHGWLKQAKYSKGRQCATILQHKIDITPCTHIPWRMPNYFLSWLIMLRHFPREQVSSVGGPWNVLSSSVRNLVCAGVLPVLSGMRPQRSKLPPYPWKPGTNNRFNSLSWFSLKFSLRFKWALLA